MVEGARLESVYRGNSIEGSNPSLSAKLSKINKLDLTSGRLLALSPQFPLFDPEGVTPPASLSTQFPHQALSAQDGKGLKEAAPQDFIVLACARLDSLAHYAIPGKLSQSEKFSRFLDEHSRHGEVLSSVSVGDLYSSFLVELWQLPGGIELPGRLRMFDEVKQRDFIDLY